MSKKQSSKSKKSSKQKKSKKESKSGNHYQTCDNSSSENDESKLKRNAKNMNEVIHDDAFRETINKNKRRIIEMESDGNCLFRSISHHIHRDYGAKHFEIRDEICNYLEKNEQEFGVYLLMDEDEEDVREFNSYVKEMREDGTWGGHVEIVCASRLYHRNIVVFSASGCYSVECDNEDKLESSIMPSGPDILLSYHDNSHYNCVFDDEIMHKTKSRIRESKLYDRDSSTPTTSTSSISSDSIISKKDDDKSEKVQKNEPCPCGSELKYKKCCLEKLKRKMRLEKHLERSKTSESYLTNSKAMSNLETQSLESEFQMMRTRHSKEIMENHMNISTTNTEYPSSNSIRAILDEYYEATIFDSDSDDGKNDVSNDNLEANKIADSVMSELEDHSNRKSESLDNFSNLGHGECSDSSLRHVDDAIHDLHSSCKCDIFGDFRPKMPFLRKGSRKEPSALHRFQQNAEERASESNCDQEEKARLQELEKMQEQQRENLKKRMEKRQNAREEIRKRNCNGGNEISSSIPRKLTQKSQIEESDLTERSFNNEAEETQSFHSCSDEHTITSENSDTIKYSQNVKGSKIRFQSENRKELSRNSDVSFSKKNRKSQRRQDALNNIKPKQKMKQLVDDDKINGLEEQWQVLKCMRKRQESALRDAEKEREEARSWAVQERDKVQRWVDNQKKAIERERQRLSNDVMIAQRKKRHEQLEMEATEATTFSYKKAKDEIDALKEALSKQKIESEAVKSRQRLNEKRLRDIIADKEREVISMTEQLEAAEMKKASLLEQKQDFINQIKQLESKLKRTSKQKDKVVDVDQDEKLDIVCERDDNHVIKCEMNESHSIQDERDAYCGEVVSHDTSPDQKTKRALASNYDLIQDTNESWLRLDLDKIHKTSDSSIDIHHEPVDDNDFSPLKEKSYDPSKYMTKSMEKKTNSIKETCETAMKSDIVVGAAQTKAVQNVAHKFRRVVTYANHTEKEILPDGTTLCRFSNGDIKTTYSNIGIVVYFYAKSGTSHTTHADGLEVFEFASGQIERHFPNGEREVIFPDGTKQYFHLNGKSDIIYPDGIKVSEDHSKKVILNF